MRKSVTAGPAAATPAWVSFLDRHSTQFATLLVLLATVRIVATYSVFSHIIDEPAHIGCGMEWLVRGTYTHEAEHPPLARVAGAFGLYLLGVRPGPTTGPRAMHEDGLTALYEGGSYDRNLAAARLGELPFFWVAAIVLYLWARRDFGSASAVGALFCFTFLPSVLAHAGFATTDMALTAWLGAAFFTGRRWLEMPCPRSAAMFGVCGGLAIVSKFSSLPYFAASASLALAASAASGRFRSVSIMRSLRERLPSLGVAAAGACVIIWAMYRFSVGPVDFLPFSIPAPPLFAGIRDVLRHNEAGHISYFLGQVGTHGFRGYYEVVLGVKTPIAILALLTTAIVTGIRKWGSDSAWLLPVAYAAGILIVASFSRINIGVRHILPVYTGFAILAGSALIQLGTQSRGKWAAGLLVAWLAITSLASHPDYLPYFNEFAGRHPEKILVGSDLDWGQDFKRLTQLLEARGAASVSICITSYLRPQPGEPLLIRANPTAPIVGWNAVSLSCWKELRFGLVNTHPEVTLWPDHALPPPEVVGKSIYLWYFTPPPGAAPR